MTEKEMKEALEAGLILGKMAAAVFQGALEQTGSEETAKKVTEQYIRASIKPDSATFLFGGM
jgi:hypothetical protein